MKKFKRSIVAIVLIVGMLLSMNQTTVYAKTNVYEKPIVIVLDPGHGGHDSGATCYWGGRWYREKTLNLAIAKACKAKLEQYAGVQVHMTRSSDYFVTLGGRVRYAKDRKAASYIQKELVSLGIKNNGIHYRNTENGSKYPNKSKSDYYSVIRQSKLSGFPGLIVEHAFVSNSSDCSKFFSSADKLKKLGEADAKGLAKYYGLVEKDTPVLKSAQADEDGNVHLQWDAMDEMDGYRVYRRAQGVFSYTKIATIRDESETDYVDKTTKKGTTYYYMIAGYHNGRKKVTYTDASNIVKVTALETLYTPQNLKVTAEQGTVQITWESTEHTDGYIIERKTANDADYQMVAKVEGADITSYTQDNNVTTADYRICSYRKYGKKVYQSKFSEIVTCQL